MFRDISLDDMELNAAPPACTPGTACNDNDACTTGETYDSNCQCNGGTLVDADNDGVCDTNDQCAGVDDSIIGTSCNDNDPCTSNDVYDGNCSCAGTFDDADGDGVCDINDICGAGDDNADADSDGTPDACDSCNNNLAGTVCDDNDACTTGETYDANCNCSGGTFQDSDNDTVCDANDNTNGNCTLGGVCDDGDINTTNDVYDTNCNCSGTIPTVCQTSVNTFPYTEGFESGLGQWSQSGGDDLDWTRNSNGTPSSNTGPSSAYEGTWYMYIEASNPNYPTKTAGLISPCFNLSGMATASLNFQYHMYGNSSMVLLPIWIWMFK